MKKNKRVIILLSVLILGIGVSLAYFVGKTIFSGTGATTEARTATVNGSILDIDGILEFDDSNIYPGHKKVSKITVTATGENEFIAYNLIWQGINGLNTTLKYEVYKTTEEKEVSATCTPKKKVTNGIQYLNEECNITGIEELEKINEGEIIHTEETTIKITENQYITSKPEGEKVYYYVVIEYPNLTSEELKNQNGDIGQHFEGKVHAKISNKSADINILGIYIKDEETGKYEEATKMPDNNYAIVESKCSNNAEAITDLTDNTVKIKGLTLDGTSCYLYYDKLNASEKTLNILGLHSEGKLTEEFTGPSCDSNDNDTGCGQYNMDQNGIYESSDDDGTTYYFRGSVTNNYIKFGKTGSEKGQGNDMYWRIIRINGDGSIRIIYDGITANTNGDKNNVDSIAVPEQHWNIQNQEISNDNKYLGLTWSDDSQVRGYTTKSNVLNQLEDWYKSNLTDEIDLIDKDAGFCNDRQPSNITTEIDGNEGTNRTFYGAYTRIVGPGNSAGSSKQIPTFKCSEKTNKKDEDLYTISTSSKGNRQLEYPIGLITADEASFAGGYYGSNNFKYYLYNGQGYWAMSPSIYISNEAITFRVYANGQLAGSRVNESYGIRPVINLKADTRFAFISGEDKGTINNPYIA